MQDIVDLTTSPDEGPPPPKAQQRAGGKRRRAEPTAAAEDAIDLAAEEEAEEAAARQRIMAFARRVNAERAVQAAGQGPQQQQQQQQQQADQQQQQQQQQTEQPPPQQQLAPANALLAQLHAERMARLALKRPPAEQQQQPPQQQPSGNNQQPRVAVAPHRHAQQQPQQQPPMQQEQPAALGQLRLLTYNVWFAEDVHVEARMAAIGRIIEQHQPDFICFQEVTPLIVSLFSSAVWWAAYASSPCPLDAPYFTMLLWRRATVQVHGGVAELPFANSRMGRDLKSVAGTVGGLRLRVATSHLESPTGWDQLHSEQRVAQLKHAAAVLDQAPEGDLLLAGDMNWGPSDGPPPLPGGWTDAWQFLFPGDAGLTYDPKSNPMLKPTNRIRRRLDRVFCRLQRLRLAGAELVGRQALPGLQHEGRPVLPSDHFGLLLTLEPASGGGAHG